MAGTQMNVPPERGLVFIKHFHLCERPEHPQVKLHNEIGL